MSQSVSCLLMAFSSCINLFMLKTNLLQICWNRLPSKLPFYYWLRDFHQCISCDRNSLSEHGRHLAKKKWKRHVLVVIVNAVPLALWSSGSIIEILHGRFSGTNHPCKSPFSWECAIVEGCVPFVFERYLPGFDNSKNCTSVSYFLE